MTRARLREPTAGLAEARWALQSRAARAVLRRELARLLHDGYVLGPCKLRRVKLKPGRKLSAYLVASLRGPGGSPAADRAVAVTWGPGADMPAPARVRALERDAARAGVDAPFASLWSRDDAWGMTIEVSPLDVSFPQLVRMCHGEHVASVTPAASSPPEKISTIRYRPRQRHVLRYDWPRAPVGRLVAVAKLYNDGADGGVVVTARSLARWLVSEGAVTAALEPLAHAPDDGAVLWPGLSGAPLSRRLHRPGALARDLHAAGALLRKLHDAPATLSAPLPSHDLAHELRLTARACEHIAALDGADFERIERLLGRVGEGYARTAGEDDTLVHADYKLDHLWRSRAGLTILDFDGARRADPALDVGKLLADLRWWNAPASCRAAFLDGYGEGDVPERSARARLWEVVWLVKAAARRVPITDPDWTGRTRALVALAERSLHD